MRSEPPPPPPPPPSPPPPSWTYALLGAGSLGLQVVLLREFLAAFHSSELFAGAVLGVWLLWVGLGSALGARASRRLDPARTLAALYAVLGLLCVGAAPLARMLPWATGLSPGFLPGVGTAVAVAAAAMLLPCMLVGASFPLTAAVRSDAARLYVWDSAGGVVGGVAVAAAVWWLAPDATVLSAACAAAFGGLSLMWGLSRRGRRGRGGGGEREERGGLGWRVPGICALSAAALVFVAPGIRRAVERRTLALAFPGEAVVQWEEAPDGRWVVTRSAEREGAGGAGGTGGTLNLYVGGALQRSQADESAVDEFAALAVLTHPGPRRVVVLSHPADPLPHAIARACPGASVEAVVPYQGGLPAAFAGGASKAGGTVSFTEADARAHVRSLDAEADLIVYQPGLPEAFLSSRMLTRESFAEAAAALRPGGVLAVRLPFAANYQNEGVRKVLASVVQPLRSQFAHVRLEPLPLAGVIALASAEPIAGLEEMTARYAGRGASLRGFRPALLGSGAERMFRLDELARAVDRTRAVPNTDLLPAAIRYQERVTRSMYGGSGWAGALEPGTAWPGLVFVAVVALGCVLGVRGRRGTGRAGAVSLAFAAGAAGMLAEVTLLCMYQVSCGALYREIALLLALVLAGTAAGAHCSRRGGGSRGLVSASPRRRALWSACCLAPVAALALLTFAAPGLLSRGVIWLLAPAIGAAVGAAYPAALALGRARDASEHGGEDARRAGYVLAADLAGAAAGSILGGGFFIPVLGLNGVALLALGLALAAAGVVVAAAGNPRDALRGQTT